MTAPPLPALPERDVRGIRFRVRGRVQGVGFRAFCRGAARAAGVGGWVRNLDDGSVEALAQGDSEALERFRAALRRGPSAARVDAVEEIAVVAGPDLPGEGPLAFRER